MNGQARPSRGDLLRAVRSEEGAERESALALLRSRPDVKAVGALIHELRRGTDGVADVLVAYGADAVPALMRSLARPRPLLAVDILARMDPPSTRFLLTAFEHRNQQVRTLAAMAVGRSDDPQVPFELLDRVSDPSQLAATRVALIEWGRYHHHAPNEVLERLLDFTTRQFPPEAVGELIVMLGSLEDPRVVRHLIGLLDNPGARRWWSISLRMLVWKPDPMAERTFLAVASNPHGDLGLRLDAIRGLARLRSQQALSVLDRLAASPQQRPVLPSGRLPREELRKATEQSLREQHDWKVKLVAQAAADHIRDPSRPIDPDYRLMGPLMDELSGRDTNRD